MKICNIVILITLALVLTACKPSAKVAEVEAGVEAQLISDENFTLDFGEKVVAGIYTRTLTLSNSGKFPIKNLVATPLDTKGALIYSGDTFPGKNGTCSGIIESHATCIIEFEFHPDHEGSYSYNIDLDFNTGISPAKKIITVKAYSGSAAYLKFDDASDFDFGIHEVTDQVEKTFIIHNIGGLTAMNLTPGLIDAPFYFKGGSYPGTGGTCSNSLKAYSSCSIAILLQPTVNESALKNFGLDYFNGNGQISFTGSFQALIVSIEADLVILASGIQDFGSVTFQKGVAKKFKLLNKGYLNASQLTFIPSTNFIAGTNTCSGQVIKSNYCEFNILFYPNTAGVLNESFSLSYNSGKQIRTVSIGVKGKGITPAILTFDALNINSYGNQAINSEKKLTYKILNTGDWNAASINISSSSSDFVITNNFCFASMIKGGSCTFEVTFKPVSGGIKTGNIDISYNNGSQTLISSQALIGQASALAYLKFSSASYSFGVIPAGVLKTVRMLVSNNGLADAKNVRGPKEFPSTNFYYRGDFSLASLGKVITDYQVCPTVVDAGQVCRNSISTELYYNDNISPLSYVDGVIVPDCSAVPGDFCKLDTSGVNAQIHAFSGQRVSLDYPACGDIILAGQTCQIVFDFASVSAETLNTNMSLNYINDNLVQSDYQSVNFSIQADDLAKLKYVINFLPTALVNPQFAFPSFHNIGDKVLATIQVNNIGQYDAYLNNIDFADPNQTNFAFSKNNTTSSAPGFNLTNSPGSCYLNSAIPGGGSCKIYVWFSPQQLGNPLTETLKLNYNDGKDDIDYDLDFSGVTASIAKLSYSPTPTQLVLGTNGSILTPTAVQLPGNSIQRHITVTNSGSASFNVLNSVQFCNALEAPATTSCGAIFPEGSIDNTVVGSCIGQDTYPGNSCTLDISYSPQFQHLTNNFTLLMSYVSAGITINTEVYGRLDAADPAVLHFQESGPLGTTKYDFSQREYLTSTATDLTLENQSGIIDATSVVYSIENDPNNFFSVDYLSSTCSSSVLLGQNCTVNIVFTPNLIGDFTATLRATYFDGKQIVSTTQGLKGTGEAPRSIHKGWSNIFATGTKVNILNVSDNNRYVDLSWNDMLPKAGSTISGYKIYRRAGNADFNYSTPINTGLITTKTYHDSDPALIPGNVYYYEVRPFIDISSTAYPSRTVESFREVRVTIPFDNMSFVHRWMANALICQKLGKVSDMNNNNRCSYAGIGSKNSYFDLGYDLMVDRFELGADKTSKYGQLPLKDSQLNMLNNCNAQGDFNVFSISKTISSKTLRKRLLSRKEYEIAGMWNPTNTDSTTVGLETGLTSGSTCNGANGSAVEKSGNNFQCKSYFGIEDMAGNEIEWVSDRISDGVGITDQMITDAGIELRLDTENKDLAGIDFTSLIPTSGQNLSMIDAACFTVPLGLSVALNPNTSSCLNSKVSSSLGAPYFHNNIYSVANYSGIKGLASGGAAYINGSSGLFSSYWIGVATTVGARCTIKLDY